MSTASPQAGTGRRVAAMVLVLLATLLAFLAIFAIWVNRQLLDTDNWTQTSTEILQQPAVQQQLAARLTDELYRSVDVESAVRDVLPPRAEPLAGPAASALRTEVEKTARTALGRPAVQQLWADANRTAHMQLLDVLNGGSTTVSTANGKVVLDLRALLAELQQRVGVGGRLSRALPANATQITVLESKQLNTAQTVVRGLRPLPLLLIALSLACAGIAMAIAPGWRRQALRAYGVGFVAAGAAALVARSVAGDAVVGSLTNTAAAEPAVQEVWQVGTSLLVDIATAAIVYGVLMLLAAWLAGSTSWATAVRRTIAPYLREPAIAYGVLAVVVLGLIWWAPTPAWRNVVMLVILVALLVLGVEMLRRQVIREFPDATRAAATGRRRERIQQLRLAGRERAAALRTRTHRAAAPAEPATTGRLEQLERLAKLRQAGILDADEFQAEKQRILGEPEQPIAT